MPGVEPLRTELRFDAGVDAEDDVDDELDAIDVTAIKVIIK